MRFKAMFWFTLFTPLRKYRAYRYFLCPFQRKTIFLRHFSKANPFLMSCNAMFCMFFYPHLWTKYAYRYFLDQPIQRRAIFLWSQAKLWWNEIALWWVVTPYTVQFKEKQFFYDRLAVLDIFRNKTSLDKFYRSNRSNPRKNYFSNNIGVSTFFRLKVGNWYILLLSTSMFERVTAFAFTNHLNPEQTPSLQNNNPLGTELVNCLIDWNPLLDVEIKKGYCKIFK